MSNGQGQGGGKPPNDDRTLLDPLSNDELRALREARQRMQAKKETSAVAHQIVIGPDTGDDIGDAPTRAMPSLPSFEGQMSLDQISAPPGPAPQQRVTGAAVDPATVPAARAPMSATPSDPMSVHDHARTAPPPPGGPQHTQPGFGENTLLWMQPPKQAPMPQTGSHNIADFFPKASRQEITQGRLKSIAAAAVGVLLVSAFLYLVLFSSAKGTLELRSVPSDADVFIDGEQYGKTPVKLTLSEGSYQISLQLDGHETSQFTSTIKGEQVLKRDINLVPRSRPGLMTVKIEVQPIAAKISVDGAVHAGKRVLLVPNVDPKAAHKIEIEAPGYVKIVQDVRKTELKSSYSFVLAKASP